MMSDRRKEEKKRLVMAPTDSARVFLRGICCLITRNKSLDVIIQIQSGGASRVERIQGKIPRHVTRGRMWIYDRHYIIVWERERGDFSFFLFSRRARCTIL